MGRQATSRCSPEVRGTRSHHLTEQETKTVTVKEVDKAASAVTILTEDGKTMSLRVSDSKLTKDLKAGDKVVITYTKGMAISVE